MSGSDAPLIRSRGSRCLGIPVYYMALAIALPTAIAIVTLLERQIAVASLPVVTIKMLDVPAAFEPGT
jgi:hypothetical protein